MTPASSSARTRRRQALGESATRSASSRFVMRPSFCSRSRSLRSVFPRAGVVIVVSRAVFSAILLRKQGHEAARLQSHCSRRGVEFRGSSAACRGGPMTEQDRTDNPMGTDGFEFIEYTAPNPELLGTLFEQLGFSLVAKHRSKD